MGRVAFISVVALLCGAQAAEVSPVEKVIELLEDLKSEVETEGQNEAATYDTFACFCKSTTEEKAQAIKDEQDNIEGLAASMQEQTEISHAKSHEIKELDQLISNLDKEMAGVVARREAEKTKYESQAADLSKGISSLEGAIADMAAGMPSSLASVKVTVRKSILMAEALNVSPQAHRALSSLLQEEPEDNSGSSDIISTLEQLNKDFKARKSQLDQIEGQNSKDFDEVMKGKTAEKKTANDAKSTAEGEKSTADEKIAEDSDSTVLEEAALKDDELYMKDLTEKCELKAREWDQRSQMRADEVGALTKALGIIQNKAKDNYHESTSRDASDLMQKAAAPLPRASADELDFGGADLSFLQVESPRKKLRLLAAKVASSTSMESRQNKVIDDLVKKGKALNSPILTSVAIRVGADPFLKVKKLVQNLIERLIQEAAEEATKKGWCDTEMGKATMNRNSNMDKVMSLNAELMGNQALKAQLTESVATLTTEISELNDSMAKQTKLRTQEKAENMETLDKAKEGLAAVRDAKNVLVEFYKKGSKGSVSLLQASPVDAPETAGGAYKGGQQKAGGIVAMLDVIISDFSRSIKVVSTAEKDAHRAFVEFERTTKTSLMEKETGKSQAELDSKSTEQKITEGMDDMDQHQKMLDDSLKTLEDLKPACVDTGMSYADRVAKREEEINALKKALCELDADKVETECQ